MLNEDIHKKKESARDSFFLFNELVLILNLLR